MSRMTSWVLRPHAAVFLFSIFFAYQYFSLMQILQWLTIPGFVIAAVSGFQNPVLAVSLLLGLLPAIQYLDLTEVWLPVSLTEIFLWGIFAGASLRSCFEGEDDQHKSYSTLRLILGILAVAVIFSSVRQIVRLHEAPGSVLIRLIADQVSRIPYYYQLDYFYFLRRSVTFLSGLYLFWILCRYLKDSGSRRLLLWGWITHAIVAILVSMSLLGESGWSIPFDGFHEGRNAFSTDCLLTIGGVSAAFTYWRGRFRILLVPLGLSVFFLICLSVSRAAIFTAVALLVLVAAVELQENLPSIFTAFLCRKNRWKVTAVACTAVLQSGFIQGMEEERLGRIHGIDRLLPHFARGTHAADSGDADFFLCAPSTGRFPRRESKTIGPSQTRATGFDRRFWRGLDLDTGYAHSSR
ncbi:MAG: hypothetical protein HY644_02045 [Acidobacteria bacterium]|nr:hypothetical protein [Acidobacteriota bacterium]